MPKNVSVSTLEALHTQVNTDRYKEIEIGTIDGKPVKALVKKWLSAEDFAQFTYDMESAEFWMNEDTGEEVFRPAYSKILFSINLVKYYTNINLPAGIAQAYEAICALALEDKVKSVVEWSWQYDALINSIDAMQGQYRTARTGFSSVWSSLKNIIESFDVNEMVDTLKNFDPAQLENLAELRDLAKAFAEVQPPDTGNVVSIDSKKGGGV